MFGAHQDSAAILFLVTFPWLNRYVLCTAGSLAAWPISLLDLDYPKATLLVSEPRRRKFYQKDDL